MLKKLTRSIARKRRPQRGDEPAARVRTTAKRPNGTGGAARRAPAKYVYFFGDGRADGDRSMRDILGGKGAGLAEMESLDVVDPDLLQDG